MRVDFRPRTTGEILDDAVRLALADAPLLLAATALFTLPWALALFVLLTWPPAADALWWRVALWPALFATLLPLAGLGSAACQEAFRRRADGKPATLLGCLAASLRRALDHMALATFFWLIVLLVPAAASLALLGGAASAAASGALVVSAGALAFFGGLLALGGMAFLGGPMVHAVVADGERRWGAAWAEAFRQAHRHPGKVAAIALTRPLLLLLVTLNLAMSIDALLFVGDQLAGFDLSLAQVVLSYTNPVYAAALLLLAWLLLAPFFEASNYLLHIDARTRHEGLDLWYRVRRHFPAAARSAGAALLLLGLFAGSAAPAHAAADPLSAVRAVRADLDQIREAAKQAAPYRADAFGDRLHALAVRLDRDVAERPGRFRWFDEAVTTFVGQNREAGQETLTNAGQRLGLVEDLLAAEAEQNKSGLTREQIRALLPSDVAPKEKPKASEKPRPPEEAKPERPERRTGDFGGPRGPQSPGIVGPQVGWNIDPRGMLVFLGVVLGVMVVVGIGLAWKGRPVKPKIVTTANKGPAEPTLESLLTQNDRTVPDRLWKQADDLAAAGRFLDAVRTLYNAVLAQLHRADLIRYAPTRTNGDYVDEVRERTEVYMPFRGLTGVFEVKWYGEKSCLPDDYQTCRRLAEQVRAAV